MPRRSGRRRRQSPRSRAALRRSTRHPGTQGRGPVQVWDAGYQAAVAALRDALGEKDFESAWAEGAALSVEEAIAYAQRGRGERKRAATGWGDIWSGKMTQKVGTYTSTRLPHHCVVGALGDVAEDVDHSFWLP